MAQQAPERTVVINGSGDGGSGGMGMGMIVGVLLVVVLGIAMLWFDMSGRMSTSPTSNNSSTTNVQPNSPALPNSPTINIPDIKIPDTITINTPQNAPAP